MGGRPKIWEDAGALADSILKKTSGRVVLAIPLGLGKPVHLVNILYQRACADPGISLKIYTALTLEKPAANSELERRFIAPLTDRLFKGYAGLDYAKALRRGDLPGNIEIVEFFLTAGQWLGVDPVQQNYVSANYTDAAGYILDAGINVVAQMVACDGGDGTQPAGRTYSLSCNPDITIDLLKARREGEADFQFIGQINNDLPFMGHDAEIAAQEFDHILEGECAAAPLYNTPKRPVSLADYAAGFHAARLIPDGGTLQIGIGSVGDAIAHALIMRHRNNAAYRAIMKQLAPDAPPPKACDDRPFSKGLYGASEMLVDTFLDLIDAGVVRRQVDGCLVHAAFFLGPRSFYQRLRDMPQSARDRIGMSSVSFVNDAHEAFEKKRRDRKDARFINNAMKATLLGAVISDGLESGQVVSGVGGQFDFVRQSFALKDARSVIMLNAVRGHGKRLASNIVWKYAHQTIPRHLRDIIITEYGVADLRGKSDAAVITEMLSVADARFQEKLIADAKEAGKLPGDFRPPQRWKNNLPQKIQSILCAARDAGLLPEFPFGTDFTESERDLLPALEKLKAAAHSKPALMRLALAGWLKGVPGKRESRALERMQLVAPDNIRDLVYRYLLRGAFHRS